MKRLLNKYVYRDDEMGITVGDVLGGITFVAMLYFGAIFMALIF